MYLKAGDKDLAAVVTGDLALLDEGDGRDKSLDGGGELAVRCVLGRNVDSKQLSDWRSI